MTKKSEINLDLTKRQKWEARVTILFFLVMMLPADVLQTVLSEDWDARLSAISLVAFLFIWVRNSAIRATNRRIREVLVATGVAQEQQHASE